MTYLTKSFIALIIAGAALVVGATGASAQETPALPEESTITEIDLSIIDENATPRAWVNFFTGKPHAGLNLNTCLNGQCDEVDDEGNPRSLSIGGLFFWGRGGYTEGCNTDHGGCIVVGYCIEEGTPLVFNEDQDFYSVTDGSIDPRAVYLAWRYDAEFHGTFTDEGDISMEVNGNVAPIYAAVQALIWGYVSDVETGSTVWNGYSYNDAVVDPNTGFQVVDGVEPNSDYLDFLNFSFGGMQPPTVLEPYLYEGDSQLVIDAANAYIVQLHAEASTKQGPWVLAENADSSGLMLTGSVGPIVGERITFDNGDVGFTDGSGFVAWPEGATSADVEAPGRIFRTDGLPARPDVESQNALVVQGKLITVTRSAPPVEEPPAENPIVEDPVQEGPVEEDPKPEDPVEEDSVQEDPVDEIPETEEIEEVAITDEAPETEEELPATGGMHLLMIAIAGLFFALGTIALTVNKLSALKKIRMSN